jgi:AraC-like DNA-binding protein
MPQFLSPDMITVINRMLNYDMGDAMAGLFYDGAVNQLLVYLLNRISGFDLNPPKVFSGYDMEQTNKAKDICVANLSKKYTLRQLSQIVHINLSKLQECFKSLYGVTFYQYVLSVRMETARRLIMATEYTIQDIAEKVGYTEGTNLTAPFKKYFGYTPEYLKLNKKDFKI